MILVVDPKVASLPISISSSNDEHFNDLARAPLRPVSGVEILHLFGEANDFEMSFRNLKKKAALTTNPSAIIAPLVSQIPPLTVDPVVELTVATVVVQPSPSNVFL